MTLERRAQLTRILRALLRQPGELAGPDRLLALAIGAALGFPCPGGPRAAPARAASMGASGTAGGPHGAPEDGEGV